MSTTYTDNNAGSLTMDNLLRTMTEFRTKHGRLARAIKVSDETLRWIEQNFPVYPSQGLANTLYGLPIQTDNDLALFECELVYDQSN